MRSIKTFVLALLAATMALASVSASSATAEPTAVCAEEPTVVEGMERCPAVSHLEAESTKKAKFLTGPLTVECDVSFLGMESSIKPVVFTGNFTYSNCGKCKVTEEKEAAALEVLWTSHEKANVTGKSLVHIECSESIINCTYTSTTLKGTFTGALLATNETGEISFVEQKLTKEAGGPSCPEEAAVDLEMKLTSPAYLVTLTVLEMDCLRTWFGVGGLFLSNPDGITCKTLDLLLAGSYELAWLIF